MQEEGWVVCRAFKKKITGQTKSNNMVEGWESNYFYDEATTATISSIVDPLEYITRQPPNLSNNNFNNLLCKQETSMDQAAENNLNFSYTNSDQFIQLPQLESPSLPLLKRPISSMSLVSDNNNNNNNNHDEDGSKNVTADWRALDKFVASQLSHEETTLYEDDQHNCSDLGMLLLLSDRGEGPKLNEILSSSSEDSDIGICLFDK